MTESISYHNFPEYLGSSERNITAWLRSIASEEGVVIGKLIYNFVNNAELLKINKEFLNHDYFTDIISFDYSEGEIVSGEIFISLEQVRQQAEEMNEDEQRELLRVIVHGLLHLIGYDDHSEEDIKKMRMAEENALVLHAQNFGN